jgi:hypothetical protein
MALATGMTTRYDIAAAGGLREDLEDKIWDLYPEDSWALTNLDKVVATGTFHEWLKDDLAAAASNTALEGNEASFTTLAAPSRLGNYCQISYKAFLVSGSLEAVSKAGRSTESARQTVRKMRELKNDMEWAIVSRQGSQAGDRASARVSAGMEAWISTNQKFAATSTAGTVTGYSSGIVAAATTGATAGSCSEGAFKTALQAAWVGGGNPRIILANASTKAIIDGFTGVVTRNINMMSTDAMQAKIIGAANVYVSSFATSIVVLHRHVTTDALLAIDPDYWAVAQLRTPFMEQLAKTGDGTKYQILAEWCLVSRNEKSSASVRGAKV